MTASVLAMKLSMSDKSVSTPDAGDVPSSNRPRILFADEPTGNLDEHTAETLHGLLREMHRDAGLTSVIATHNARLAALCDRVLRLEDGVLR